MSNNRGQVLVVFILLLPIFFMVAALIIDGGLLFNEKRKVDNTVKEAIRYGINNIDEGNTETDIKKLINKNVTNIEYLGVDIKDGIVTIKLTKNFDSIFAVIFNKASYDIQSRYYGYKDNNKIVIKEE